MACPYTQMRLATCWKWFLSQEIQKSASNTKEGWSVPTLEHFSSVVHMEAVRLYQVVSSSQ